MNKLKQLIIEEEPTFFKDLDSNLKLFAKEVRKMLRDEEDCVIGITGYPGKGKSNDASVLGLLIDDEYSFEDNICFIPSSKEIETRYMKLKMFSFLHIDEASKGLHKQKWYDKIQQKLNTLYDTEREGHFLCTALLMPRFQNFTENFRNFRIIYWIHVLAKGICIVYRKDEDKDTKDPWHIDENYKKKKDYWKSKKVFQRSISEIIRAEQKTPNYWFYFRIPAIPERIWEKYKQLKKQSRVVEKEQEQSMELESYKDKMEREKMDKWTTIKTLRLKGYTQAQIGAEMGISTETVRRHMKTMQAYEEMKGEIKTPLPKPTGILKI